MRVNLDPRAPPFVPAAATGLARPPFLTKSQRRNLKLALSLAGTFLDVAAATAAANAIELGRRWPRPHMLLGVPDVASFVELKMVGAHRFWLTSTRQTPFPLPLSSALPRDAGFFVKGGEWAQDSMGRVSYSQTRRLARRDEILGPPAWWQFSTPQPSPIHRLGTPTFSTTCGSAC